MTKEFPDDPAKIVSFEDLLNPVCEAALRLYPSLTKKAVHELAMQGTTYNGFCIHSHTSFSPEENLTAEGLEYADEHGRPPYVMLLTIAAQLGVEQGKRIAAKEHKDSIEHMTLDTLMMVLDLFEKKGVNQDTRDALIERMKRAVQRYRDYSRDMDKMHEDTLKRRKAARERQMKSEQA